MIIPVQGQNIEIDPEDFDRISKYKWHISRDGYVYNRRHGFLHNFLIGRVEDKEVDHKDRNKLNNKKDNLRRATVSENRANRVGYQSLSGLRGVYMESRTGKWYSQISVNGKGRRLGTFPNKETAAKAYDEQAKKYFGEFAILNFHESVPVSEEAHPQSGPQTPLPSLSPQ